MLSLKRFENCVRWCERIDEDALFPRTEAAFSEIFLRKPRAEKEIINDYNGDLVKFFWVLQNSEKLSYLIGRLYLSFNSEQIFRENKQLLQMIPNTLDDIKHFVYTVEDYSWEDIKEVVAFLKIRSLVFPLPVRPLLSPNGI